MKEKGFCTCGVAIDKDAVSCPTCGRRHLWLNAEPGSYKLQGYPPTIIIDGRDPDTGNIQVNVDSPGARSEARETSAGDLSFHIIGVEAGRQSEPWIIKTLRSAIAESGTESSTLDSSDDRGEDAVFHIGDHDYIVQICTTPSDGDFWRAAAMSSVQADISPDQAIAWLRQTIEKKADQIPPDQRGQTVLAIDARLVSLLAQERVSKSYISKFGSPSHEFDFASVWIVGPTTPRSMRLGDGFP